MINFTKLNNLSPMEGLWISGAALIGIICLGSIAMAYGGFDYSTRLLATIISSMATLVCFLSLQPTSVVLKLSGLCIFIDIVILLA